MAKLTRRVMQSEVPGLRRVGSLIYKESVAGINICVYEYGTERKKKGTGARGSGMDYTLNIEPIPIELAINPTPETIKQYFDLDEVINRDSRLAEIDRDARIKGLSPAEKEKLVLALDKDIAFLEKRKENWPKVIQPDELERLKLFANYVSEDRKLRARIRGGSETEQAEKHLKSLGKAEREALLRKLGYI